MTPDDARADYRQHADDPRHLDAVALSAWVAVGITALGMLTAIAWLGWTLIRFITGGHP